MRVPKLRALLHSNLVLGIAALAAGVAAAWLGAHHLRQREADLEHGAKQRFESAQYVVASQDMEKGQRIDASLLAVRSMPKSFVPADALTPERAGLLIGGRAAIGIRRGTPVVLSALTPEHSAGRLSESLPLGMRALTIQVDQLNAMSGHLEAGDTVDLYYSRAQGGNAVLIPLLQRVHILATGDIAEGRPASEPVMREFSSVTLLVSGSDAQRIVLAEQTGRLTLLLRRPADEGTVYPSVISSAHLLRGDPSNRGANRVLNGRVELLIGGNGGNPSRSWLSSGVGMATSHGEGI